ncbi:MAG: deoxyribose-phosphate aldolase, partial [Bryobacteraceae bacterium]
MDPNLTEPRPPLARYEDIAKMIDHSLLRPELNDEHIAEGCSVAREHQVASVTVRPSDVDLAVRMMEGSGVAVGTVAGFPHGSTTTAAKLYEVRDVLRRGVREVDLVLNIGKLISRQFQFVDTELQ